MDFDVSDLCNIRLGQWTWHPRPTYLSMARWHKAARKKYSSALYFSILRKEQLKGTTTPYRV